MDFWTNEEVNPKSIQPIKEENQAINFDDFQNFDADAEEKEKSEDLLQSQDFENSKNRIYDNLFSQNDFGYPFQQHQNQILPSSAQEIKSKEKI